MVCERVPLTGGGSAIVCSSRRRPRCACGRPAPLLCDWKVPIRKSGTCDAPICHDCAAEVGADKHLCPAHDSAWQVIQARRAAKGAAS